MLYSPLLGIISHHAPIRLNFSSLNTNNSIIHGLCDRSHSLRTSWHVNITSLVTDSTISYLTRRGTHLSTAETIAAVPAPKTSSNDPFFSASTRSPIVIFLSDTLKLDGRPGMDLPSMWPRHRFNTLYVSFVHGVKSKGSYLSRVTPGRTRSPRGAVTSSTPPSGVLSAMNKFMVPTCRSA